MAFNRDKVIAYMTEAAPNFRDPTTGEVNITHLVNDAVIVLDPSCEDDDDLYYDLAYELWESGEL